MCPMPKDAPTIEELRLKISAIERGEDALSSQALSKGSKTPTPSNTTRSEAPTTCTAALNCEDKFQDKEYAFKRLTRLCMQQERCTSEAKKRLARMGFPESVTATTVARAVNCGLIDDVRYGDVLVRSRIAQGKGLSGIRKELEHLQIDPCNINELCRIEAESDNETEINRAVSLLNKRSITAKNKRDAAYRRLITKGFSPSIAGAAVRRWLG